MAFQFPDPQTTPEFTADNGITYSWDVDDSKWQIKGFHADGDLEARVEALEKALFPYVEFTDESRRCIYYAGASYQNPCVKMEQYWGTSSTGEWTWAWMVKFPGSDKWTNVDDLSNGQAAEIGYEGTEGGTYLHLYPSDANDMPDIEVSLKVTDSLEGFETAEGWSDPFHPPDVWINQGQSTVAATASVKTKKSGRGQLPLGQS